MHYSLVIKARVAAGGRIRTDNKLNGTGVFDKYGEKITGPRARQDLITPCQAWAPSGAHRRDIHYSYVYGSHHPR